MEATGTQRSSVESDLDPRPDNERNALQLIITRSQELANCPFWVSLYRQGTVSPQQLFEMPSIEGIFKLLMDEGLKENQALMLAENIEGKDPKQFYLIPEKLCATDPDRARDLIVTTLEALGPERVGLYLPKSHADLIASTQIIEEISLAVSFLRTKELHLFTGNIGMNPLLNAALRIKNRLDGRREVLVYH